MRKVRNVIFDLGGVALDWNPDQIVSRFQPVAELQGELKQALFAHPDWLLFDRGALTESELVDRMQARIGLPKRELTAIIDAVRESLVEKPETVKLIRALQQRGTPLFCLSNMPASIYAHLRRCNTFWDAFRGIVISSEIRMIKPEPQVFMHLLERFNLTAEESVFVDDVEANVAAAGRVGLQTIWFKNATQCERELEQLLTA